MRKSEENLLGVQMFNSRGFNIQVYKDERGEPWFIAKHVCKTLGIAWRGMDTLDQLDSDWKGVRNLTTPGGAQEIILVSEPGLYCLASRSNKPEARRFMKAVYEDVLPSIRKTGVFIPPVQHQNTPSSSSAIDKLAETVAALAGMLPVLMGQGIKTAEDQKVLEAKVAQDHKVLEAKIQENRKVLAEVKEHQEDEIVLQSFADMYDLFVTYEQLAKCFPGMQKNRAGELVKNAGATRKIVKIVTPDGTHRIPVFLNDGIMTYVKDVEASFVFFKECDDIYKFTSKFLSNAKAFHIKKIAMGDLTTKAYWEPHILRAGFKIVRQYNEQTKEPTLERNGK